jgi:hypothetical protein
MIPVLATTLVLLTIVIWFWAIIDIMRSKFQKQFSRTIWILMVLLFPILGSILYFQFKTRLTVKASGKFQPTFNQ